MDSSCHGLCLGSYVASLTIGAYGRRGLGDPSQCIMAKPNVVKATDGTRITDMRALIAGFLPAEAALSPTAPRKTQETTDTQMTHPQCPRRNAPARTQKFT